MERDAALGSVVQEASLILQNHQEPAKKEYFLIHARYTRFQCLQLSFQQTINVAPAASTFQISEFPVAAAGMPRALSGCY